MAQFSVKKIGQFDEAFLSKEKWPILMAFKKKQKKRSYRTPPLMSFVLIAYKTLKKGRFWIRKGDSKGTKYNHNTYWVPNMIDHRTRSDGTLKFWVLKRHFVREFTVLFMSLKNLCQFRRNPLLKIFSRYRRSLKVWKRRSSEGGRL